VFIKLSGVGKSLCKCKGVEKSQFYTINKNLDRSDWVGKKGRSVMISRGFGTKRELQGNSEKYREEEEDEKQEDERDLEEY